MVLFIKSRYIWDMSQLLLLDGAPGGASPELFRSLNYHDSGLHGNLLQKIVGGVPACRLLLLIQLHELPCCFLREVCRVSPPEELWQTFSFDSRLACALGRYSNVTSSLLGSAGFRSCCRCCYFQIRLLVCSVYFP
jgi:hypothetical protein